MTTSRARTLRTAHLSPSQRRSVSLSENVAVLLLVLLLFGQLFVFGANTALLSAIAALTDVLVALVILLLLRPADALWFGLAPVLFPLALALCWAAIPEIATPLLTSPPPLVPELFPLEWAKLLGAFACLLSGAALGSRPLVTRRFVDCFLAIGFAWTMTALLLRQADPWSVWGYPKGSLGPRFTATLLNTNAAGCTFGVIAIVATGRLKVAIDHALSRGWNERSAMGVAACATVMALTLAACALTQSRASLTFAVLAMAIVIARSTTLSPRARVIRQVSSIASFALLALGLALLLMMPIRDRLGSFAKDAQDRLSAMEHFGGLVAQSPWFGYGLGSFATVNAARLTPDNVRLLWNFGAAHSAPIHAALEAGIPFVALIVVALAIALRRIASVRRLYVADPLMFAQFAAVAVVFLCSLADIELSVPALAALTAVLSGLVLGRTERAIWSRRSAAE